jgi:hypothetical protein
MIIAGGTAAKLVVYPIASGSAPGTTLTNWAICIRTGRPGDPPPSRQDWARPADRAELAAYAQRFKTPHLDHIGLVTATAEAFEFPMYDRNPLPYWSVGRVTLLGDAAHPMYPMGSNGAGQAILDATSLSTQLARHAEPAQALLAYQDERLPATSEVVLRDRMGGPEGVIDEVERRAPDGFTSLTDVIDPAELQAVVRCRSTAPGHRGVELPRERMALVPFGRVLVREPRADLPDRLADGPMVRVLGEVYAPLPACSPVRWSERNIPRLSGRPAPSRDH